MRVRLPPSAPPLAVPLGRVGSGNLSQRDAARAGEIELRMDGPLLPIFPPWGVSEEARESLTGWVLTGPSEQEEHDVHVTLHLIADTLGSRGLARPRLLSAVATACSSCLPPLWFFCWGPPTPRGHRAALVHPCSPLVTDRWITPCGSRQLPPLSAPALQKYGLGY